MNNSVTESDFVSIHRCKSKDPKIRAAFALASSSAQSPVYEEVAFPIGVKVIDEKNTSNKSDDSAYQITECIAYSVSSLGCSYSSSLHY